MPGGCNCEAQMPNRGKVPPHSTWGPCVCNPTCGTMGYWLALDSPAPADLCTELHVWARSAEQAICFPPTSKALQPWALVAALGIPRARRPGSLWSKFPICSLSPSFGHSHRGEVPAVPWAKGLFMARVLASKDSRPWGSADSLKAEVWERMGVGKKGYGPFWPQPVSPEVFPSMQSPIFRQTAEPAKHAAMLQSSGWMPSALQSCRSLGPVSLH